MKDVPAIITACREGAQPIALATVVYVSGSSYRRPGARMLVCADGARVGSVSGGCLEADVAERAKLVAGNGRCSYVLYDSSGANGDLQFELGCDGAVGIFIQPIKVALGALEFIAAYQIERRAAALATVIEASGSVTSELGAHAALTSNGIAISTITDKELELAVVRTMAGRTSGCSGSEVCELATGSATVFIESIIPPIAILIFGTGPDTTAMMEVSSQLGWQVRIADWRPGADRTAVQPVIDERTAVLVMTHHYNHDLTLLKSMFDSPAPYIGVIGSRARTDRLMSDLQDNGLRIGCLERARLHAPAGLDIGSESPDEIALSIAAEIMATFADRPGGSLRDGSQPIHG